MREKKDWPFLVQLRSREKTALKELARERGESMGAVVRRLIEAAGKRHGLWPSDDKVLG
jgi:hypothetical protein